MKVPRPPGIALLLTASFLFGASAIFAKLSYDNGAGVLTVLAGRSVGGALIAVPLALLLARQVIRTAEQRWRWFVTAGFSAGSSGLYMAALSLDDVGRVAPIVFVFPVLAAVIGWALFRVPLGRRLAVALVVGMTGTMLVFGDGLGVPSKLAAGLLALATAFAAASYFVFAARWAGDQWLPATAAIFGLGAIVYTPIAAGTGSALPDGIGWLWLAGFVVLCSVIPYFLQVYAIGSVGSTKAGILAMLEPMVAVLGAVVVLDEGMTGLQGAGAALVLTSFVLATVPGLSGLAALRRRRA